MGFGSPWILWALLAVAIPIIIHLFYFRRYKKIYFSDIQFLKAALVEQKKLGKLKNILILLSRILAILFLVLAFALPFFGKNEKKTSGNQKVIIYLDNTFSMSYLENNKSTLDKAKTIANSLLDQMGDQQQVMVLTNDVRGEDQTFLIPEEAKKLVDKIQFTSSMQSLESWNAKVAQLMEDLHEKEVQVYYISDFQSYAMPQKWDSLFVSSIFVQLGHKNLQNISIDSVSLLDPVIHKDAPNQLLVKVRNQGAEQSSMLSLSIAGAANVEHELNLKSQSTQVDTITFFAKNQSWQNAQLYIQDAQLGYDNNFYFSVRDNAQNKVLLLETVSSPNSIFHVFQSDPHFIVRRSNTLQAKVSQEYSLVVLNQIASIPPTLEDELVEYVKNGGNIYIVPDEKNADQVYNSFLNKMACGQFSEWRSQTVRVAEINQQEPIVNTAFDKIPQDVDLPQVKKFWVISSSYQIPESSIMKMDNGRPFIQKYQVDKGLVYLQTAPLNSDVNDFASKVIFPPLIYNFAVIHTQMSPLYYTIGKNQFINDVDISIGNDESLKLSNGQYELIPPIAYRGQKVEIEIPSNLEKDGIYELKRGQQLLSMLACNYDRKESEMKFFSADELKVKYPQSNIKVYDESQILRQNAMGIFKSHIPLWKVCVILAFVFLIAEIVLIRLAANKPKA